MANARYRATPYTYPDGDFVDIATDVNGNIKTVAAGTGGSASQVQGNVAASSTDSGNPVKTGGMVNNTPATYTDGQRGDTQLDTRGNTKVTLMALNTSSGLPLVASNADAQTTGSAATRLEIISRGYHFNGTTFDRMRGDTTGTFMVSVPTSSSANTVINSTSTAYEASRVIKSSAGRLYGVSGYNSKASAQFIQLFNSTTVPADTAVPVFVMTVPASSNFSIDFGTYGRFFSTGIAIANSSTGPTKTVGSADCFFDAQYA